MAEPKLPGHPSVQVEARDVKEPDPLLRPLANLPRIGDLPEGWTVFLLQAANVHLKLSTTLPRLWEQVVGHQERLLVVSELELVLCPGRPSWGHVCDAMPDDVAVRFEAWAGAQCFVRRSKGFYAEVTFVPLGVTVLGRRLVKAAELHTNRGTVRPAGVVSFPVDYLLFPAEPEVMTRAAAAVADPQKLVTKRSRHDA